MQFLHVSPSNVIRPHCGRLSWLFPRSFATGVFLLMLLILRPLPARCEDVWADSPADREYVRTLVEGYVANFKSFPFWTAKFKVRLAYSKDQQLPEAIERNLEGDIGEAEGFMAIHGEKLAYTLTATAYARRPPGVRGLSSVLVDRRALANGNFLWQGIFGGVNLGDGTAGPRSLQIFVAPWNISYQIPCVGGPLIELAKKNWHSFPRVEVRRGETIFDRQLDIIRIYEHEWRGGVYGFEYWIDKHRGCIPLVERSFSVDPQKGVVYHRDATFTTEIRWFPPGRWFPLRHISFRNALWSTTHFPTSLSLPNNGSIIELVVTQLEVDRPPDQDDLSIPYDGQPISVPGIPGAVNMILPDKKRVSADDLPEIWQRYTGLVKEVSPRTTPPSPAWHDWLWRGFVLVTGSVVAVYVCWRAYTSITRRRRAA
ncbi:MAG: hypothetical protein KatS3mg110_1677 [Pirellulaceae bacterium]|nr:MAG: hypothetical protein KatS3mg110_1677 [Pirellulaceae bacterium]